MFGPAYFGTTYYGPTYFGPDSITEEPVTVGGGYVTPERKPSYDELMHRKRLLREDEELVAAILAAVVEDLF